jgi:hypothetical protein
MSRKYTRTKHIPGSSNSSSKRKLVMEEETKVEVLPLELLVEPRTNIFVYTAQHTGTWFLIHLLETAEGNGCFDFGDANARENGRQDTDSIECKYITDTIRARPASEEQECVDLCSWLENSYTNFVPEERKNQSLAVYHGHHFNSGSPLCLYLKDNADRPFPIVTSIRDPLLAIQTLIWREYNSYLSFSLESLEERLERTIQHTNIINDLLSLPNIFYFPIDQTNSTVERTLKTIELFNFCGLKLSDRTKKFIQDWEPHNTTKDWVFHPKGQFSSAVFECIKKEIAAGNKEFVKEILSIEFNYLHTRDDLKEKFSRLGYSDMIWW